jgi:hypothetical protein
LEVDPGSGSIRIISDPDLSESKTIRMRPLGSSYEKLLPEHDGDKLVEVLQEPGLSLLAVEAGMVPHRELVHQRLVLSKYT